MMFKKRKKFVYIIGILSLYVGFIGNVNCYASSKEKTLIIYNEASYKSIIPHLYHVGFEVSTSNDTNFNNSLIDNFDSVIYYSTKGNEKSNIINYINQKDKKFISIEADNHNSKDINYYEKDKGLYINGFTGTDTLENALFSDYIHTYYKINDNDKAKYYIEIKNIDSKFSAKVLEEKLKILEPYSTSTILSINPLLIKDGVNYELTENSELIDVLIKAQQNGFIIAVENNIYIDDIRSFFSDYSYNEADMLKERREALHSFFNFRLNTEMQKLSSVGIFPVIASFSDNPNEKLIDKKYNSEVQFKESLKHLQTAVSSEDIGYSYFDYGLNGKVISGKRIKFEKDTIPLIDAFIDRVNVKKRGLFYIEINETTNLEQLPTILNKLEKKDVYRKNFSNISGNVSVDKSYYEIEDGKAIVSDEFLKEVKIQVESEKQKGSSMFNSTFFYVSVGFAAFILIMVLMFIYIVLKGKKKRKKNLFKE